MTSKAFSLGEGVEALVEILGRLGGDDAVLYQELAEMDQTDGNALREYAIHTVFQFVEQQEKHAVDSFVYRLVHRELGRTAKGEFLLSLYKNHCMRR